MKSQFVLLVSIVTVLFLNGGCDEPDPADPCEVFDCGDHGDCVSSGASAWCDCDEGYEYVATRCVPIAGDGDGDVDGDVDGDSDGDSDGDADGDGDADDCGDGTCGDDEDAASCEEDCPAVCGDDVCTHDETAVTCHEDCVDVCGDGMCRGDETAENCEDDCPAVCGDGAITHDEDCEDTDTHDCTTSCGSTGTQRCDACHLTACEPPEEVCNGDDDDCDGAVDEPGTADGSIFYRDADDDSFGDADDTIIACSAPTGYVDNALDCDDGDSLRVPGEARFAPAAGGSVDLTAAFAAGMAGAPAAISVTENGVLSLCGGTYYATVTISASMVIVQGEMGSTGTTLSGGGIARAIEIVAEDVELDVMGLTITEANGCSGAAIGAAALPTGCGGAATVYGGTTLTLDDVIITGNSSSADGVVLVSGGSVDLTDSQISNNTGAGVWLFHSEFDCLGTPTDRDGVWGNTLQGVYGFEASDMDPTIVRSDGCDWGEGAEDNGEFDIDIHHGMATLQMDFGDDASFTCNPTLGPCR